jgi:hypothetical protein
MQVDQPRRVARAILSMGIDVARWYDPGGRDSPAALGALYADLAARMVSAVSAVGASSAAPGSGVRTE